MKLDLISQAFLAAHDSEVLGLDWAPNTIGHELASEAIKGSQGAVPFLASSGRDGFVHVFSKNDGLVPGGGFLAPYMTLDDHHGAAVAALRFGDSGRSLVSCGGDRSVAVRKLPGQRQDDDAGSVLRRLALSAADCTVDAGLSGQRAAIAAREGGLAIVNTVTGLEVSRYDDSHKGVFMADSL